MNTEYHPPRGHPGTEDELNELTEKIIGCAITMSRSLGPGFLEKVYENALCIELRRASLNFEQQKGLTVFYDGEAVGDYFADILVEGIVLLELKAMRAIEEAHQAQMLNYLKTTGLEIGLILNFGTPRLGIKRMRY